MRNWQIIGWVLIIIHGWGWVTASFTIIGHNLRTPDLHEVVKMASPNDTLVITKGEYLLSNLIIDKPLTLIGLNLPTFISKEGDELITILSDGVTISGIEFKGVTTSYLKERATIRIKRAKHFAISKNVITHCFFGIYLEKASEGIIEGNQIYGNATTEAASGNGIHAWHSSYLTIQGNYIERHRDGIYFEFVDNSCIERNRSYLNKRYGLHFMFSNNDSYALNTFQENGVGVAVMFSRFIVMDQNKFYQNWGKASYGLLLKEIFDAEIDQNLFESNTIGIFVEGSNRIKYRYNNFKENGWAFKFSGGCEDNLITQNNFLANSMDLVANSKLSSNKIIGNYWDSYAGYDLDKNGIGDIPHFPVKLFSYIVEQVPEAIILLHSIFIDLVNFAEKVSPVFTPKEVFDPQPYMQIIT